MESRVLNMAPRGEKLDVAGEKVEAVISESELGTFLDKLAADEQWKKYLEGQNYDPEGVKSEKNPYRDELLTSKGLKYALNYRRIESTKGGLRVIVREKQSKAEAAKEAIRKWHAEDSEEWSSSEGRPWYEKIPLIGYPTARAGYEVDAARAAEAAGAVDDAENTEFPYDFRGFEYVALVWPQIEEEVKTVLDTAEIPTSVRTKVLGHVGVVPAFDKLILAMATSLKAPGGNDPIRKDAISALKKFGIKEKMGADAEADRAILRHGVDTSKAHMASADARAELRKFIEKYPTKYDAKFETDNPLNEELLVAAAFDRTRVNTRRRQTVTNAGKWNPLEAQDLAAMKYDWQKLEMPINEAPLKAVFNQLAKASDKTYLDAQNKKFPGASDWFQHPDEHRDQIAQCDGGQQFLKAWEYYKAIKAFMIANDQNQAGAAMKKGELDKSPLAEKIGDGLKANVKEFTGAIRRGDYATAAVYVAGAVALMHVLKIHSKSGDFVKKWGAYAVLAYAGVKVLEKAGVPILKGSGIEGDFEELTGTNMGKALYLPGVPELRKVDPKVFLIAADFKMSKLFEEYQGTHGESNTELGWIDPLKFDYYRKKFGLMSGDATTRRNANKEYDHVGKHLYKLIDALQTAYHRTMFSNPNAGPYYRKTFEDAFINDATLRDTRVEEFLGSIIEYAQGVDADVDAVKGLNEKFGTMLEGENMAPNITLSISVGGNRVAAGEVMGIPVVVANSGGKEPVYSVYSRKKYEDASGAVAPLATLTGKEGAEALKTKLEGEFKDLIKDTNAPQDAVWDGANWSAKRTAAGNAKYAKFGVILGADRTEVVHIAADGTVDVKNLMDPDKALIEAMLDKNRQSELSALRPFMNDSRIRVVSDDPANLSFVIEVAGVEATVEYDDGPKKFTLVDSKALLKSNRFREQYAKLMVDKGNRELNDTINSILQQVEGAPESAFMNAVRSIAGKTGGKVLDGSIARNRTRATLNAVKYATMQKLRQAANQVDTIEQLSAAQTYAFGEMNSDLQGVLTALESHNGGGKAWTAEEYASQVLSPIRGSIPGSTAYREAFQKIERESYALGGPVETTDWSEEFHNKVEARMKKFSEYAVDGGLYTFTVVDAVGGTFEHFETIDLDNLTTTTPKYARNAAGAVPGQDILAEEWKDPGMRGWYMLKYNDYVLRKVMSDAPNIQGFDVWAAENGISSSEIAEMQPFDNANADAEHAAGRLTALDKAVVKAFDDTVDQLERDIPGFKADVARQFLRNGSSDPLIAGILDSYQVAGQPNRSSELYAMSMGLSGKRFRKAQQETIRKLVDEKLLRDEIFKHTNRYFSEPVSWTNEFKMNHPWIINWPVIGGLFR